MFFIVSSRLIVHLVWWYEELQCLKVACGILNPLSNLLSRKQCWYSYPTAVHLLSTCSIVQMYCLPHLVCCLCEVYCRSSPSLPAPLCYIIYNVHYTGTNIPNDSYVLTIMDVVYSVSSYCILNDAHSAVMRQSNDDYNAYSHICLLICEPR